MKSKSCKIFIFVVLFACAFLAVSCQNHAISQPRVGWERLPEILGRIKAPVFPDRDFDVTDFGAAGDGKTKCTEAFDKAIRACHQAKGGRVVVPEGIFLTGPIHLLSNVCLEVVFSGPMYKSMKTIEDKIEISFDYVGDGLATREGKEPDWFEIAGEDRQFHPAKAQIAGNRIIVSTDKVASPAAVRFAWDNIAEPNLTNKNGLPASSFRTDNW